MLKTTVWEYIRVKFTPGTARTKMSRPTRIYKISYFDKEGILVDTQYAPAGIKGTVRRIDPSTFITEWEHGPTPTPRPLRMYGDEELKKRGYSIEQIREIRGRNFSAKDVKLVARNQKITNKEAREALINANGSRHAIYVGRNTVGRKIDGKWKTIIPGEKRPVSESQRRRAQSLANRNRLKTKLSKSKKKIQKRKHKGRF